MLDAAGPYAEALGTYLRRTTAQFDTGAQSAQEVAQVIVAALTADRPPFRLQTSTAATTFVAAKLADLDGSVVQSLTLPWVTP